MLAAFVSSCFSCLFMVVREVKVTRKSIYDNADKSDLLFLTEGKALQIALEEGTGKAVAE